jgi:SpoVK/Ycf46/Vps4 family AAA+-type ATPase
MKGYRVLFYGPPGTGKSLTATLMGKECGKNVYRIDLSQIVSKYIGETEKNLSSLFQLSENKNWILFFDEADALFGKRTEMTDAKDKYANQETSYLLQRIEDFQGLIILATNFKPNIDSAFLRRFQSIVYFKIPGINQREKLWEKALSRLPGENEVDVLKLANDYEIAGGFINNVVQFAWLNARKNNSKIITNQDVLLGIKREFAKEGKIFNS